MNFCDFRVFVLRYRAQNENPEITGNLSFTVFFLQLYQSRFFVCLSLFFLAEFVIPCTTAIYVISVVSAISEFSTWPGLTPLYLKEKIQKMNRHLLGKNLDVFLQNSKI